MAKFRLATVLRARNAQESAAKTRTVQARLIADGAAAEVHRQAATLDAAADVDPVIASALAVAMSARHAMAAALSAAIGIGRQAEGDLTDRQSELAVAASQRRAMERLAARHQQTRRRAADAAERRELDDLTAARHCFPVLPGGEIA
jgi:flagellar FliJ protein